MNLISQASINYAYKQSNLTLKCKGLSNMTSTELRRVDILAKKIASTDFFKPGDVITYSIIITNPGNYKAESVIINDDLFHQSIIDNSFKFLFLSANESNITKTISDNNIIFEIDELAAHEVCIISYQVKIEDLKESCVDIRTKSVVSSNQIKPFNTNSLDLHQRYAELVITKKTVDYIFLNSDIEYIITIHNKGNIEAIDIEVIDKLPLTFELLSTKEAITANNKEIDIYTFDNDLKELKFIIDKISAGETLEISIKGKIIS